MQLHAAGRIRISGNPPTSKHMLLLLQAMSSPITAWHFFGPYRRSPTSAILVVVFVVLFISGMSSLLLFKCYMRRRQRRRQTEASLSSSDDSSSGKHRTGLESSTLAAFPTFVYANVKHLRPENLDLECAICLSEYEDDSVLRLLTICYHVFHQECVDVWLQDHTSCPVCRAHLDLPPEKIKERLPEVRLISGDVSADTQEGSAEAEMSEDAVSIEIGDDDEKEKLKMWSGEQPAAARAPEWYPRWHSTGHNSFVGRNRSGNECRFTLRLPDNVESAGHGGGSVDSGGGREPGPSRCMSTAALGCGDDSN